MSTSPLKPERRRRWLLPLTACTGFVLTVAVCMAFAAGGISYDAVSAAPSCTTVVEPAAAHQTGSGRGGKPTAAARTCRNAAAKTINVATAAANGFEELAGVNPHDAPGWDPKSRLWFSYGVLARWWETALAMTTYVRYLETTHNTNPRYQHVILRTFYDNIYTPHAWSGPNFVNQYLDDTGWWGLAWLDAARYELAYRHDVSQAQTFLREAEIDAAAMSRAPRACGGIAWKLGTAPDAISNAEFISLAAGLAQIRGRGVFADASLAARWRAEASSTLKWLMHSRLLNLRTGWVADRLTLNCKHVVPFPLTYNQGEVAQAFTQTGIATGNRGYLKLAKRFLLYMLTPGSGLISHGIIHELCEVNLDCERSQRAGDLPAWKGVFMRAVSDWSLAAHSHVFDGFVRAQVTAILRNTVTDGAHHATTCQTPHRCQFGFYWLAPLATFDSHVPVAAASQASALDALTASLRMSNFTPAPGLF